MASLGAGTAFDVVLNFENGSSTTLFSTFLGTGRAVSASDLPNLGVLASSGDVASEVRLRPVLSHGGATTLDEDEPDRLGGEGGREIGVATSDG